MASTMGIDENEKDKEERDGRFRDAAVFRYVDGNVKVMNEGEFIKEFKRRNNDLFWRTLECIQTCIKSKVGLGRHFFIPFKVKIIDAPG